MRKLLAIGLAGALTLGTTLPAFADSEGFGSHAKHGDRFEAQFADWQSSFWGNEALSRMITKGVMQGNGNGTIAPQRPVTRLEAAIMLTRLLSLKTPTVDAGQSTITAPWGVIKTNLEDGKFTFVLKTPVGDKRPDDEDSIPAWGREAILTGLQNGFLTWDTAKLNPMAPLTRLEAAVMLVKAAGQDEQAKAQAGTALTFTDANKIPDQLKGYIAIAVQKGFVQGFDDGSFQPQAILTRAQWAALLDRLDLQGPAVSADGRQVQGTVTAVTTGATPSITMTTPVFPAGVTYPVNDTAVFYDHSQAITIADVKVGDQVVVNLSTDRQILLLLEHNVVSHVSGTVTAYTAPVAAAPTTTTPTTTTPATTTPATTTSTTTTPATTTSTTTTSTTTTPTTTTPDATAPATTTSTTTAPATTAPATAAPATTDGSLTLTVDGTAKTYAIPADVAVKLGDQAGKLSDVLVGDKVTVTLEGTRVTEIAVSVEAYKVEGKLTAITPGANNALPTLTVATAENQTATFTVADTATIKADDQGALTLADLKVGQDVKLLVQRNSVLAITLGD